MKINIKLRTSLSAILSLLISLPSTAFAFQANAQQKANGAASQEQVAQEIISKAEERYQIGEAEFARGNLDRAREEFDRALDIIFESSIDVRTNAKLKAYYRSLVEKIHNHQIAALQDNSDGFSQQQYVPSPLDELAKTDIDSEHLGDEELIIRPGEYDFDFEIAQPVLQFIAYFTKGRGRYTLEHGLRRSGLYRKMAENIFKEEGVPLDLVWLAQAESLWQPTVVSYAAAKGIWQFIPSTGQEYGLNQNSWVDERSDPEKSTRAAARYLKDLSQRFAGDWLLAMAAYNTGPGNVERAIARCGYADFWELHKRGYLHEQTRNYVPIILAIMIIAKNQERYGFNVKPEAEWTYDTFEVPSQTDLRVVAELLNVPVSAIQEHNPQLRQLVTPPGHYTLRLPDGTRDAFEIAFNNLPEDKRLKRDIVVAYNGAPRQAGTRYTTYLVKRGETLSKIAGRFGISRTELARLNSMSTSGKVRAGQTLRVPIKKAYGKYRAKSANISKYSGSSKKSKYRARSSRSKQTKSKKR